MHNIGFAICGVEGSCVESFGNFSRKKSFRCHFFRNLVSGNFFCFMQFLIEISVVKARTSQSRFPLWRNPLRSFRHNGSADYIRFLCAPLRGLRTTSRFAKSQERKQTSFSGLRKSAEPLAEIIKKARENQYPKINTTYSIIYFFNFLWKYKTIV